MARCSRRAAATRRGAATDAAAHQGREGRMRPTLSAGAATYATGAESHGQRAVGKAVHAVGGCL